MCACVHKLVRQGGRGVAQGEGVEGADEHLAIKKSFEQGRQGSKRSSLAQPREPDRVPGLPGAGVWVFSGGAVPAVGRAASSRVQVASPYPSTVTCL